MTRIRIGIFGGSGYGGSELLRILLQHTAADIRFVTANEHAGKLVTDVHKNLRGFTQLKFVPMPVDQALLEEIDVAFFALPHGQALRLAAELPADVKVIDLSGDFRLGDAREFLEFYGLEHAGEFQRRFVYGLTETNRESIRSATHISNPGCFATATLLATAPLVKSGLLTGSIVVDAKTGSSGSGIKPASNTHHPQRMHSFYAYKPFQHQHLPEISQHLRQVAERVPDIVFMTHSLPVARGIFATCYFETSENLTNADLASIYTKFYEGSPFIRLVDGSPDINWVKTTNFCDIASHSSGRRIVVFSAIDNLVKGAAGQAVQNMNLMFGIEETTGLMLIGTNP
jgi:N-acetyl-gamma-glutamyl-phosphate reductase common form